MFREGDECLRRGVFVAYVALHDGGRVAEVQRIAHFVERVVRGALEVIDTDGVRQAEALNQVQDGEGLV
jgi:hypothetical protein